MNAHERRQAIWEKLCVRRQDTAQNLAVEFGVSRRTIWQDINQLTLTHPLETNCGRYGGGVKIADWYQPTRTRLCPKQIALLKKVAPSLQGEDLTVMNSIISQFTP